ncbi:hypothetical protein C8F04DRAFT_1192395 [Mycena alexandri]|uniref:Uncharacterized protein n=1 Tax=Mycena alexandri TaxID=1745969 RepID=A0AAD6SFG1_9AGAR|nr:hypothetical protein C8F04DRAFT_1192395 [Mycena alexandri]
MQTIHLLITTSATPKTVTATSTQSLLHKVPPKSTTPTQSLQHKLPPTSQEELDKKQMEAFLHADRARTQTPLQVAPTLVGSGCRGSAEFDSNNLNGFFDLLKAEDIDKENAGKPTQDSVPKKSKRLVGSDTGCMPPFAGPTNYMQIGPTQCDVLVNTKALMTSGQKANRTTVLQLINNFYKYKDQCIKDIWDS